MEGKTEISHKCQKFHWLGLTLGSWTRDGTVERVFALLNDLVAGDFSIGFTVWIACSMKV
jgi:hypothetical protein